MDQQRHVVDPHVRHGAVSVPGAERRAERSAFLDQESEFFGGQRVNALFSEISATVDTEFEWLPYMEYAYTSFNETIGSDR